MCEGLHACKGNSIICITIITTNNSSEQKQRNINKGKPVTAYLVDLDQIIIERLKEKMQYT